MKALAFSFLLAASFSVSCGDSGSKTGSEKEAVNVRTQETKTNGEIQNSSRKPAENTNTINGDVNCDLIEDGGSAESGKLRIGLRDRQGITGKMDLGGSVFLLTGIRESKNLRIWVSKETADPLENVRGYLYGEVQGDSYVGSFALSGNGGEPVTRGTWKTDGIFSE